MLRRRTILARRLRQEMTEAEKRLWRALRELDLPLRFRRQHPIGQYIADFACPSAKLVIELDGGQHAAQSEADDLRTVVLARNGYRVIRFWNGDVMRNLPGVLHVITSAIAQRPPHPPHR
jgi:very-short-patch-repair endonuclease